MAEAPKPPREVEVLILAKLAAGASPGIRVDKFWEGKGSGSRCNGCDQTISPDDAETEIELAAAVLLRLHQRCFSAWQLEIGRQGRGHVAPAG